MDSGPLAFLKSLVETPSPSGYEQPAQRLFREYVASYCDTVTTDVLGNVIAIQNAHGSPRVMLTGHCDQIGMIVSYINDDGFIYFNRIGGLDPTACVSQRVIIQGKNGPVYGVVGRKAVHLQEQDDRTKAPKLEQLWIDIGAKNKEDALKMVTIGDPGTFVQRFEMLANDRAVCMAFDNKMAVWCVAEAMRILSEETIEASVIGVSTVQEEIGSIGAQPAAYATKPDIAIVLDVGHATDHPGVEKTKSGETYMDKGPVFTRGANVSPKVYELLVQTAEEEGIPYQTEGIGGRSATDADPIQYSRAGVAVGLIHVPLRYMHTPSEMMSLQDISNTARLLAAFVKRVTKQINLIPE